MHRIAVTVVAAAAVAGFGLPVMAQNLLRCDVQEVCGGGESAEVIYNMGRRPVGRGDVTEVRTGANEQIEVTYGAGRPVLAVGPIYIQRFSNILSNTTDHGSPPGGNVGAVGR